MEVSQVYQQVNSLCEQAYQGRSIEAVDTQSLIALGDSVISSKTNVESFFNVMFDQMSEQIISDRAYHNKLNFLVKTSNEWGAIRQKITVLMPEAVEDPMWNLKEGQSVDQQTISKPDVKQKLFVERHAWMVYKTFTRKQIKSAFQSAAALDRFFSSVYQAIQNKLEISFESLARATIMNYMAEVYDSPTRAVNLLALYNKVNPSIEGPLKAANAKFDVNFLRFVVKTINQFSEKFEDMTKGVYNDGLEGEKHTPADMQTCLISMDWQDQIETLLLSNTFHDSYVKLKNYRKMSFWQAGQDPETVMVEHRSSDGASKTITGIIGTLFDKEALGVYKEDFWSDTAPYNAKGAFYNVYWHADESRFNDLSENFVYFYIADEADASDAVSASDITETKTAKTAKTGK